MDLITRMYIAALLIFVTIFTINGRLWNTITFKVFAHAEKVYTNLLMKG